MGGRGTFASGISVAYTYATIDTIEGIKVLGKIDPTKSGSLPEEAHSSNAYIQLDKEGVFRRMRFYNEGHLPVFEIDYHNEKGLSSHGEAVIHVHDYSAPGIENRLPARLPTAEEMKTYKKYFKGVVN
ncbi:MAG: hypothetical protein SO533_06000 [Eubacteriales bacterium]|uniref:Uncharacterized protein n=1 Tax=Candidatus Colimorpha enterica TaxID=3083063 RepID=R6V454_9BACT|nr:hypothetical protein [Eubacteriales bacterium]CDC77522.1 uncharacterized protein BN580_00467 [Candidatus Colimorpha enterica]